MQEIHIIEKPERISYEDIRVLLHKAHQENISKGIVLRTLTYSAEELENQVRENGGTTFIAMDGEKLVGTMSCWTANCNRWCYKGTVMKMMRVGVDPSYRGRGIASMLYEQVEEITKNKQIKVVYFDTADNNERMLQFGEKVGFIKVSFFINDEGKYFIGLMKWLDKCPFPKLVFKLRLQLQKIRAIIFFKLKLIG